VKPNRPGTVTLSAFRHARTGPSSQTLHWTGSSVASTVFPSGPVITKRNGAEKSRLKVIPLMA